MTKIFSSINEYHALDDCVSVKKMDVGGIVLAELDETPNAISIHSVEFQSILLSLSGSDRHNVRIGESARNCPARPGDISLIPAGVPLYSEWTTF